MHIKIKAAMLWRLAFSITLLSVFVACEDPGSIGGGFVDKTEIGIDTILVTNLITSNEDAYMGRLNRSATGRFQDDLYGDVEAISFFKPSIQRSSDTLVFDQNTNFSLRLQILNGVVYGDTSSTGTYSLYRVNSLWRGSAFRNSMDISFDESELIGQFSEADIDTNGYAEVELSGSWKEDYISYFNMTDETRDAAYKQGDFGLAVVPNAGAQKMVYASYGLSNLLAFGQDTTTHFILDWAVDLNRSGEVSNPERIILQSTFDTILNLNLPEIADQIRNVNFVRAELVFKADTTLIKNTLRENNVRSSTLGMGLTLGPEDDIAYELGFGSIDIQAANNKGTYRYPLTNLLNSYFYSEATINDLYLYLSASEGIIGYTSLYSTNSDPKNAPKIIIYGLEAGE